MKKKRILLLFFLLLGIFFLFYRSYKRAQLKNVLNVGVDYGLPFIASRELHNGFNWDLARFLGQRLHKTVNLKMLRTAEFAGALCTNEVDVVCAPLNITDERLKQMTMVHVFGKPTSHITLLFKDSTYQKELAGAKNIRDTHVFFQKHAIGVAIRGAMWETLLKEYGFKNIRFYEQEPFLITGLKRGEVAAILLGRVSTDFLQRKHPNMWPLTLELDKPYSQGIGVALNKNRTDLIKKVSDIIQDLKNDGTILMLQLKWYGKEY